MEWVALADPSVCVGGGVQRRTHPSGSNFVHFYAVLKKIWPNNWSAPTPLEIVPPPPQLGNPGSPTAT